MSISFFIEKMNISKKLINKTIRIWQPYYEEKIAPENAREIIENTLAFFNILNKWTLDVKGGDQNVRANGRDTEE